MFLKVAFSFLFKCINFKNGSLVTIASISSTGIMFYLDKIFDGTDTKQLAVPILVHAIGFTFFMLFTSFDFFTGIQKAKILHERALRAKGQQPSSKSSYIKSYKLWRMFWKILGITLINTMVTMFVIFAEIIGSDYGYYIGIWSEVGFWILASGFEFHSIGENIEKISGKKPEMFEFWDKMNDALQLRFLRKVSDQQMANPNNDEFDLNEEDQEQTE